MYPMAHLLVANAYAQDKPEFLLTPSFFLGAIAPDAIHMRENPVISKFDTHLKARGENGLSEVMAYWYDVGRKPFDVGYGIHVITDRLWINFYRKAYPALQEPNGRTREAEYRPDVDWIDRTLYWTYGRNQMFYESLRLVSAPMDHPLLTAGEMHKWRDAVLSGFDGVQELPKGKPAVIMLGDVERFAREAARELKRLIP